MEICHKHCRYAVKTGETSSSAMATNGMEVSSIMLPQMFIDLLASINDSTQDAARGTPPTTCNSTLKVIWSLYLAHKCMEKPLGSVLSKKKTDRRNSIIRFSQDISSVQSWSAYDCILTCTACWNKIQATEIFLRLSKIRKDVRAV